MKAVRLHARRDLRFHEEGSDAPGAGQALLRIACVGICGSDLHWYDEGAIGGAGLSRPLVLGHEFAAHTEKGERVAVDPAISCGRCEDCVEGNPNLCKDVIFAGHAPHDGALRESMAWERSSLHVLPEKLSDAEGAMLEPLGVALHAAELGKLQGGMHVGVFGCGPIGLLLVQLARLAGAQTILATDTLRHRVEAAKALGADQAVLVEGGLEEAQVAAATARRGLDLALEAAGNQAAVDDAILAVRPGGRVVLAGIPADDRTSFRASTARRKGLTIKLARRMKHTYPRAIDLVLNGRIDVRSLITHRYRFDQTVRAFEAAARREGLKVLIEM